MSQAVAQAGQFVIQAARATAPHVASAAANVAASAALTAAQNLIFGPVKRRSQGPRREEIRFQSASEGVGIPRVFGRQRIGGQVIWISDFREITEVVEQSRGGKGVSRSVETRHTTYRYTVSLAIGLCEGEISRIGRVWADGNPISLDSFTVRLHQGTADQAPDPLIELVEGGGVTPAFRGLAYIVFEDLPLEQFGNRVPQFNFEIERPLSAAAPDALENVVRAVTLIPGSGESVYHTEPVLVEIEEGVTRAENVHASLGGTDLEVSLDALEATLPSLESVSLVVSWFGTDLRAASCAVEPRVETRDRATLPSPWSVAGVSRSAANPVSLRDGAPAYGGTPSDLGVRQGLRSLKSRGLAVTFHPFVLMDIPPGNGLPDPSGASEQPPYPWRGRIGLTVPASDGTAAARAEVDAFFAGYAPMVRHYAQLCADEGGVEAFLLGSELRGLTRVRDENGRFPAATALRTLAAEVRAILPAAKISYAADWSEYGAYVPQDGSGDVLFPLDELWADENIDFIGIDNYMPLSDWRDGAAHLDAAQAPGIHDREYLASRITAGEGFDWYYASDADREAQIRSPITDTAHGEDWIFRVKDLAGWWSSLHFPRSSGVRATSPTAFQPEAKPVVFTELGCAAIDKAANQPNIFLDPKSSESGVPDFSSGARDDLIQRRVLEAHHMFWADPENNPVSSAYGGPMVVTDRISVYAWDARPFPDFPVRREVWADAENWVTGHWLNGRAGRLVLGDLITEIADASGLGEVDASACGALVTGYRIAGPTPARDALEPLFDLYQLDGVERGGVLLVRPRTGIPAATVHEDGLVVTGSDAPLSVERRQEADLPARLSLAYTDGFGDYRSGVAAVTDPGALGAGGSVVDTSVVLEPGEAEGRAEALLAEARAMRTTARFAVPADAMMLEAGDVVTFEEAGGHRQDLRILSLLDGPYREVDAVATHASLYAPRYTGLGGRLDQPLPSFGPVAFAALDLPVLPDGEDRAHLYLAAFGSPWPGRVLFFRGEGAAAPLLGGVTAPSVMGRLSRPLVKGPPGRWDNAAALDVRVSEGTLSSRPEEAVLAGETLVAVQSVLGTHEILAYRDAELLPSGDWRLTGLLRGLRGTEEEATAGSAVGARAVFLGKGLMPLPLEPGLWGASPVVQAGPDGRVPGAFPYRAETTSLIGAGERPLSPVHLSARLIGDETHLSWIRRTRIGGDRWDGGDVPLGESTEQYLVTGYDAEGAEVHSAVVSGPSAVVPAAGVSEVAVAQLSSAFGHGRPARLSL